MRRPLVAGLLLFILGIGRAYALDLPARPAARVNDYAGVLSAAGKAQLEAQLQSYEHGTTRQMAIAIFRNLDGGDLEDTSVRLATQWKIGGKQSADGVLITAFVDDHKLRIEVGYGLEGELTDVICARVIRQIMRPKLQAGDWLGAFSGAATALEQVVNGGPPPADTSQASHDRGISPGTIVVLIILIGLLLFTPLRSAFLGGQFSRRRRGLVLGRRRRGAARRSLAAAAHSVVAATPGSW